jgi:hypothetical protein
LVPSSTTIASDQASKNNADGVISDAFDNKLKKGADTFFSGGYF